MDDFAELYEGCHGALERFVRFRVNSADADDVLQEVCLAAYENAGQLRDPSHFKAWMLAIARRKCADYYRIRAAALELPLEALTEKAASYGRFGRSSENLVLDTLELLGDKDRQILYLYYFKAMPQADIARALGIPVGTVKSRLYGAKQNFKQKYPRHVGAVTNANPKGAQFMTKLPEYMPEYKITKLGGEPFPVKWEETIGWFIIPRLGERISWAIYDFPSRKRGEYTEMEVVGRAEVHGIEGVEIAAVEHSPMEFNSTDGKSGAESRDVERRFVAQLTDTHCRLLAESHVAGGVRKYYTFLDGDEFLNNWGFGPDNRGKETDLAPRGVITETDGGFVCRSDEGVIDVCGRYAVEINGKRYETVCAVDVESYQTGVATVQYIDAAGRTVLWKRFNRDDWARARYGKNWTELLPQNERITINGHTYVHWYDCISDYVI